MVAVVILVLLHLLLISTVYLIITCQDASKRVRNKIEERILFCIIPVDINNNKQILQNAVWP